MIYQLVEESNRVGLKMNMDKTKVMYNRHCRSKVSNIGGRRIEEVRGYVYLGQEVTSNGNIEK